MSTEDVIRRYEERTGPLAEEPGSQPVKPSFPSDHEDDGKERIFHWEDIGYTVWTKTYSHWVEFKTYYLLWIKDGKPSWNRSGHDSSPDPVELLSEAEVFCSGDVKWDGCANFHFDEQERCMLHTCGRDGIANIGILLGRVHDLAKELCPNWL